MAIIYGTNGFDQYLNGTEEADTFYCWDSANQPGDEGPAYDFDWMFAFNGDSVFGGAGDDFLRARGTNVKLYGGSDDDTFEIPDYAKGATIVGGSGVDRLHLDRSTDIEGIAITIADSKTLQSLSDNTSFVEIEAIDFSGGAGNDQIIGGDLSDSLHGQSGDNSLWGGGGDDRLFANEGNDFLFGGNGNDFIESGSGADNLFGDAGDDRLFINQNNFGTFIDGGDDTDTLVIRGQSQVTISIADPTIEQVLEGGSSFKNIEQLDFTGTTGNNFVIGGALFDKFLGGVGSNWFEGGGGGDYFWQFNGIDTISYASSIEGININIGSMDGDASGGDAEGDTVLQGFENVFGSNAQDHIIGSAIANELTGNGGDDFLTGAAGDDKLLGGEGGDTAIFAGNFANYTNYFKSSSNTFYIVSATEGIDTLTSIESFQFADGTKSLNEMLAASSAVQNVSISAQNVIANEGNAGTTQIIFTIRVDGAFPTSQSVNYNIAGSGLNPPNSEDFTGALSGIVTFAPGETMKSISLTVKGDLKIETDEALTATLFSPSTGLMISVASATATIVNDDFFNIVNGTDIGERIDGAGENDHINGLKGNDVLLGFAGDDRLSGGQGSDWLIGGRGADFIDGGVAASGEGKSDYVGYIDEVRLQGGFQGVVVNLSTVMQGGLAAGTATDTFGDVDTLVNIDFVYGTILDDRIYGAGAVGEPGTRVYGLGGNDIVFGGVGIDNIFYDRDEELGGILQKGIIANLSSVSLAANGETISANTIRDGFGSFDTVSSIEAVRGTAYADFIFGGTADESFIPQNGNDFINGGAGADTVSYRRDHFYDGGTGAVIVNLSSATVKVGKTKVAAGQVKDSFGSTDTLSNIEIVYGTDHNDTMYAAASGTQLFAEDGKDTLVGGAGKDLLDGGLGADKLTGKAGDDIYIVDNAGDKVTEKKNQGTDLIETSLTSYSISKLSAVEHLTYTGTSNFTGTGNSGANKISGNVGNDKLDGGKGNDVLVGNAGNDILTGGKDNDQFVFDKVLSGDDVIMDFVGGVGLVDQVVLEDSLGFASAAAAVAALVVQGADKILNFADGSSITFKGQANLVFVADDFIIT